MGQWSMSWPPKTKENEETIFNSSGLLTNEEMNLEEEENENFLTKRALTNKGEKNIKENSITSQVPIGVEFLEMLLII